MTFAYVHFSDWNICDMTDSSRQKFQNRNINGLALSLEQLTNEKKILKLTGKRKVGRQQISCSTQRDCSLFYD